MVEVGASIFVKVNHHLVDTAKELGLEIKPLNAKKVAIWNGSEFVFEESPWKFWSIVKGLRRWGLAPLKVKITVHAKKEKKLSACPAQCLPLFHLWCVPRASKQGEKGDMCALGTS